MKILVLGAGRMGLGAAYDLAHNSPGVELVTVADVDEGRARAVAETVRDTRVRAAQVDVEDRARVVELMRGHDAALSCVTYFHNLQLARAAVEARTHFCDLGGNNTVVDAELALDEEAQAAGVNVVPDCGLAPGMVSVLAAHGAARFRRLDELHIRVGGLPQQPRPPLDYQIVFSVEGLINEYVERARVIREGQLTEVESMTELESLDFPDPFGRMEAFQTSGGTSTLPETFAGRVRELDYKTIRYPGHCARFKLLIDLGLASSEEVEVAGVPVAPRRLLGELLNRHLPADGPDLVFIRLEFVGTLLPGGQGCTAISWSESDEPTRLRYDIIDRFDPRTGLSAMQRTTAFPASVVAQMMARGETARRGAVPQERCIPPEAFVAELARRDIRLDESFPSQRRTDEGRG
jgi:lysine 6-dehydrogenase